MLSGVDVDIHESFQVKEAAVALQQKAPPPRRVPLLTVSEVREIESVACHAFSVQDRVRAGGILFGIISCARASDLARAVHLSIDQPSDSSETAWVEASVKGAKTATGSRSHMLLPLLAPVVPFSTPWLPYCVPGNSLAYQCQVSAHLDSFCLLSASAAQCVSGR